MPARRPRARRRTSSPGTGLACVAAAVGLAAVMGVALRNDRRDPRMASSSRAPAAPSSAAEPTLCPAPPPRAPLPERPLDRLARTLRAAEAKTPSLRERVRGVDFEEARVELIAEVAAARDELGAWLDQHPSDDRANRLWDRVLRLFVALRKL